MVSSNRKQIESAFKSYTAQHFVPPYACKNLAQIRFYIQELMRKMESYNAEFGFVPTLIYTLLAQYNRRQNQLLGADFQKTYGLV